MPEKLSLHSFLPYRLSIVSLEVSAAVASTYQSLFGLRIPEWRLIAVMAESDGMTPQSIGEATRMDKVTVSRASRALVKRGLVQRSPNPHDRRSHLLTLTLAGQELYAQVVPKALEMERHIFGGLMADEIALFRALLDRIEAAAGGEEG